MSRLRLRSRDRRALVLGLVLVLPALGYRFGAAPMMARAAELQATLEAERGALARERALVAGVDGLRAEAVALEEARDAVEPWLLEGQTPLEAAGRLSRILGALAEEAAILPQEMQSAGDADAGGPLRTSSLTVRALGDLEGILRFLNAAEDGPTLLRVEELSLRTAGVNDGDLERGQLMTLSATLSGFWTPTEDEPSAAAAATSPAGAEAGAPPTTTSPTEGP